MSKKKQFLTLIIFFLFIIPLASAVMYYRYPNTFFDMSNICNNEANAYRVDDVYADCDADGIADWSYWWNDTEIATPPMGNPITSVTWTVMYLGDSPIPGGDDTWDLLINYSTVPLDCSGGGAGLVYTSMASGVGNPLNFPQVGTFTNTTPVTWNMVSNTCWAINMRRVGAQDTWDMLIDAFGVEVDYTAAVTYCNGFYNGTGNFNVNSTTAVTCQDEIVPINGEVTVYGNLTLIGATFHMNSSSDGEHNIQTYSGSRVNITDGSNITNGDTTSAEYYFNVNSGTTLDIDSSYISESGWGEFPKINRGLVIEADNVDITNTTISNCYDGLYLDITAQYARIRNNTFFNSSNTNIYILGGDDNNITSNNLTNYGYGIAIRLDADNNLFEDNTVQNTRIVVPAIHIYRSTGNTIRNNTAWGAYSSMSIQAATGANTIEDNTFYNSTYGIHIKEDSSRGSWINNKVYENTYGVYFTSSVLNTISYSDIYNNTIADVYSTASNRNYIYNSTISSLLPANDTYLHSAGNLYLVNVTFNKSNTGYAATSTSDLYVNWYTWGNVTDNSSNPIDAATVTVYNINDTLFWTDTTAATGFTSKQETLEYIENITGLFNQTPLKIVAWKNGYNETTLIQVITTNTQFDLELTLLDYVAIGVAGIMALIGTCFVLLLIAFYAEDRHFAIKLLLIIVALYIALINLNYMAEFFTIDQALGATSALDIAANFSTASTVLTFTAFFVVCYFILYFIWSVALSLKESASK